MPYIQEKGFEYPVLTGTFAWLSSLLASNHREFLIWNAVLLSGAGLLAAFLLGSALGWPRRMLLFAVSPSLVQYAFTNWDLLSVACVSAAIWAYHYSTPRGTPRGLGFALGLGTAAKLYPILFVPFLAVAMFKKFGRPVLKPMVLAFVLTYVALNAPFIAAELMRDGNLRGWSHHILFHARRQPDFNSIWYWLELEYWLGLDFADGAFKVCVGFSFLGLLWLQIKNRIAPIHACLAFLTVVLATAKVFSPQYALWLLPLFVASSIPVVWIGAYWLIDASLFVSFFRWYLARRGLADPSWEFIVQALVYARAAMVLLLGIFAIRAIKRTRYGSE